ncbi:5-keto-L-gluconate epimerase [Thermoanaerobacterium sp. DL9XJH110]|uniref:5-keto-L-gluconate epimerase n=1 Tax=Thermoanaerobacterium sp. DL9XJH110 TaxID=3386643 RepID=UPI003BB7BEBE
MKLSISIAKEAGENAPIVLRGGYRENIKKAAGIGYDSVEIHVKDPKNLDVEDILKTCEENGINVSTLGTGMGYVLDGLSFTDTNSDVREKAVERIIDHIYIAREFNAKVIIGSMRGKIPDIKEYRKYEGYALECFKRVLEHAEKNNVYLVVEAINRYETNFINNVQEGLELINKLNSKFVRLHVDTFHMNIEEPAIEESIELAGGFLGHVHFADSNRWYPGKGHVNFINVLKALKGIGYDGAIAFECLPLPDQDQAAIGALEYIRALMSDIK